MARVPRPLIALCACLILGAAQCPSNPLQDFNPTSSGNPGKVDGDGGEQCGDRACDGRCGIVDDNCGMRDCGPCGASSGMTASGGSNGGTSNGGTSNGGVSSGGASNGGISSGGASNGGISSGGASNGGISSGGASNGGISSGGASNGGMSSGGCVATSCAAQGKNCGRIDDGCGDFLDCGTCDGLDICGAGGVPNVCGCARESCTTLGATCGQYDDGCGDLLDCGTCEDPQVCNPQTLSCCVPTTCEAQGKNCGAIADGCGGILLCGGCLAPQTCGGGGTQNVCGCTQRDETTACGNRTCGSVSDGCGGVILCGTCSGGQVCDRFLQQCVTPAEACGEQDAQCGIVTDACNRGVDCGGCPPGQVCDARNRACGACVSRTCAEAGAACGDVPDGCGDTISCGDCADGKVCDAISRQCTDCNPTTCVEQGKNCGTISNGCGGTLNCGNCSQPDICGGGGQANVCGRYVDPSCRALGKDCGTITNACGTDVNCGQCPSGQSCTDNVCACTPTSCDALGLGGCRAPTMAPDGCGGMLTCGCTGDQVCHNGECCAPATCADLPGQCGTFGDGCGGMITCGCTNGSECVNGSCCAQPLTCADYAGQCGTFDNGCGGSLTCNCAMGQTCYGGSCRTPRTCADYPGQCGILSDDVGGWLSCGCSGATVCIGDGGSDTSGVCQGCGDVLPSGAQCGLISDNIPNANGISYSETEQCRCSGVQANSVCIGPTGGTNRAGVCTTCAEAGRACGTLSENIPSPYSEPNVSCPNTCGGSTPDCVGNSCCNLLTCADYPGQCGASLDNGCGGTIDCSNACPTGQGCNTTTNQCAPVRTCADYPGRCGLLANGTGGYLACGCSGATVCQREGAALDGVCLGCAQMLALTPGAECGVIEDNIPSSAGGTSFPLERETCTCSGVQSGSVCRGGVGGNGRLGVCTTCAEAMPTLECGNFSDNISSYSETTSCGTCGGATPNCVNNQCCDLKTCAADYPDQCGTGLDNGCGGTLNCSNNCGVNEGCVSGSCVTRRTCADYPGQCGVLTDGAGGWIQCGCSSTSVCMDDGDADTNAGVCRTCNDLLPTNAQCGIFQDNITPPSGSNQTYNEELQCRCSADTVCRGPVQVNGSNVTTLGVCRTCGALNADCGTISENIPGNYTSETVACPSQCSGGTPDCNTGLGQCCNRLDCSVELEGQCGTFNNGCGGQVTCGCGTGAVCQNGMCCQRLTCAAYTASEQCGALSDGCGGTLTCGCNPASTGQVCRSGTCQSCGELGVACGTISDNVPNLSESFACPNTCMSPQVCQGNSCCSPMGCNSRHGLVPDGCGGSIMCTCEEGFIPLGDGTCCFPMDPCVGQPAGSIRTDNCGRQIICQGG